jgi:hypothetical protein
MIMRHATLDHIVMIRVPIGADVAITIVNIGNQPMKSVDETSRRLVRPK